MSHYAMHDYDTAQQAFDNIREADPYRLEHLDTYSNILYYKEKRAELSHLAHVLSKVISDQIRSRSDPDDLLVEI